MPDEIALSWTGLALAYCMLIPVMMVYYFFSSAAD